MLRSMIYLLISIMGLTALAISTQKPGSWSEGRPAAGTAQLLTEIDPMSIELPEFLTELVTSDTALFYFSPTCPHCQAVMPEINALQGQSDLKWLGIATSSASNLYWVANNYGTYLDYHPAHNGRFYYKSLLSEMMWIGLQNIGIRV